MENNVEIVSLIYKSPGYLELIYNQLKSDNCKVDDWNVGIRIVLNDATNEVKEKIRKLDIKYDIFNNPNENEYYLNRVYRSYNFCVTSSEYDNVCLVNSDMVFSKDWLKNLLKHHDGINIPTSRLVESGKLGTAPGRHGVIQDFGKSFNDINYAGFEEYAKRISIDTITPSGLLMPVIFEKERFIESGMYPEGNVYTTGVGNFGDHLIYTGDNYYFRKLENKYKMKHVTVFDSIVYHIQEGEKDN